jgi:hypothetical protein
MEETMEQAEFGIYVNTKELKVARINSPSWIPSGPEWVLLTPEVNMTLLGIRELAAEKKLVSEPDSIEWI